MRQKFVLEGLCNTGSRQSAACRAVGSRHDARAVGIPKRCFQAQRWTKKLTLLSARFGGWSIYPVTQRIHFAIVETRLFSWYHNKRPAFQGYSPAIASMATFLGSITQHIPQEKNIWGGLLSRWRPFGATDEHEDKLNVHARAKAVFAPTKTD